MISAGGALPSLDDRLLAALKCFPQGSLGADIGADHGRLACHLLARDICRHVIVSDISAKALGKAKTLLARHGLHDRATFVQADGFEAIDRPVDAVAVMGMGGTTIARMLNNKQHLGNATLVLSAHTGQPALRKALHQAGYVLHREQVVKSQGRYYTVIEARRGQAAYTPQQLYTGPALCADDPALLQGYLQWRFEVVSAQRAPDTQLHLTWLKEAIGHATGDSTHNL